MFERLFSRPPILDDLTDEELRKLAADRASRIPEPFKLDLYEAVQRMAAISNNTRATLVAFVMAESVVGDET